MAKGMYIGVPTVPTTLSNMTVGSTVKLNIDGIATDFLVVHQGLPSSIYDSSCNGTWLLMKDIYTKMSWDSSDNDYANSDVHSYLNGTFFNMLDSDIQNAVKQVKIPYHNGVGNSGSIASGASGLSTKIFLLGGYEVGWTTSDNSRFVVDGACLGYFSGAAATDSKRISYYNGEATNWWLRSPYTLNAIRVWSVYSGGGSGNLAPSLVYGVRPALIMPSNSIVTNGVVTSGTYDTAQGSIPMARKVKKIYVGVNGIARRVKKAYIGVDGIARCFFSSGQLAYYGTTSSELNQGVYGPAATHVGDYAVIAGGYDDQGGQAINSPETNVYNKSLTKVSATNLTTGRYDHAATHVGNYALFGGGLSSSSTLNTVEVYDSSLTKTSTSSNLRYAQRSHNATHIGDYAIFGCGYGSSATQYATAYNSSLTRSAPSNLSDYRFEYGAAHNDRYALFAGGTNTTSTTSALGSVDAYNASLTKSTATSLTTNLSRCVGTTVGEYALFAGGRSGGGTFGTVQSAAYAYNNSLTQTILTNLSVARQEISATHIGGYALFAGGYGSSGVVNNVDAYDLSLTRTDMTALTKTRYRMGATHIGDYALFAGGIESSTAKATVYVYTV